MKNTSLRECQRLRKDSNRIVSTVGGSTVYTTRPRVAGLLTGTTKADNVRSRIDLRPRDCAPAFCQDAAGKAERSADGRCRVSGNPSSSLVEISPPADRCAGTTFASRLPRLA